MFEQITMEILQEFISVREYRTELLVIKPGFLTSLFHRLKGKLGGNEAVAEEFIRYSIYNMNSDFSGYEEIKSIAYGLTLGELFDEDVYEGLPELFRRTLVSVMNLFSSKFSEEFIGSIISVDDLDFLPYDIMTVVNRVNLNKDVFIVEFVTLYNDRRILDGL